MTSSQAPSRLREYRRKRDFSATPEPAPAARRRAAAGTASYVIQLHHARRRHFDFRLELDGSLRSWAIPKGPSLDPATKRLAVEVEDHPLAYGKFEGDIPQGHYGAGHVDIWDRGRWRPDGDARAALKKGHLRFELFGERLDGHWNLVRTHLQARQPQWLLIKSEDTFVRPGDIADDRPLREWRNDAKPSTRRMSASSASSAADGGARRSDPKKTRRVARSRASAKSAAPLPTDIGLQLARRVERAPPGDDWLHEVKYDGYRTLMFREGRKIKILSRNSLDWTDKLPALRKALLALPCENCILDGELVALDEDGRSRFDILQRDFGTREGEGLTQMVFDCLFLDGEDLRERPQIARKKALAGLLADASPPLHLADYLVGEGAAAVKAACEMGIEGIVAKACDAPYREGRGGAWLKIKCVDSDEFAIVGYTPGKGAREKLGALLLAQPDGAGGWRYVGRAGSGVSDELLRQFLKLLKPQKAPVELADPPTRADLHGVAPVWVRPQSVVEIEFRGWTGAEGTGRRLRQASIKGLRPDKSLESLAKPDAAPHLAPALSTKRGARMKTAKTRSRKDADTELTSAVVLTHPERRLFEEPPITKQQIADFYTRIAERILPELIDRPLSAVRCPDGIAGTCFFQKHLSPGTPKAVRTVPIKEKDGGTLDYFYVHDLDGLIGMVQMNMIELHPWGAKIDDVERPDRVVIDLDPAPDVKWPRVVEAALAVRERLAALKLQSFARTSGGKGLHVVFPLTPGADWETVKAFAHAIARSFEQEAPDEFIASASKSRRAGKIFIDYLRNGRGATSIASYSLRARAGAPIATPLAWEELPKLKSGSQFNFANLARRLAAQKRDPWAGIADVRQRLPKIT